MKQLYNKTINMDYIAIDNDNPLVLDLVLTNKTNNNIII